MKKFLKICIAAAVFALSLGVLAACGEDTAENEKLVASEGVSVELTATENGCRLQWKALGGISYDVYRASSRYGKYLRVGTGNGSFEDDRHFSYYRVDAKKGDETLASSQIVSEELDLFGEKTYVFAPTDDATEIARVIDGVHKKMETAHFTDERYAFLFKAGDYGNVTLKAPYYTTFAGLGETQDDVSVGTLSCEADWNTNALINFWRGVENLTVRYRSKWAVSQGAFLRNVHIKSDLYLHDDGTMASGGFLANARVDGAVISGSQQQWFTRNSKIGSWSGKVWNMVFAGVEGAPHGSDYTTVEAVSVIREKPYLFYGKDGYALKVPALLKGASGYTAAQKDGRTIPFEELYFAHPEEDTAASLNQAIAAGKHIVFTPGVYPLSEPVKVERAGTVLLGMGLATLLPTNGNSCLEVGDVGGVSVCGLLFDAGVKPAENLAVIGTAGGVSHADDPTALFDCFFRVGGNVSAKTYAENSLVIHANDCMTDNIWLWRADHGSGVGWGENNGDYGLVVDGDGVSCYGLFSEHFKKNNVSWKGNNGNVIFFQSEIAYDVPSNEQWMNDEGGKGWASFRVHDGVTAFTAQGLGIYSNFDNKDIVLGSAMRIPSQGRIKVSNLYVVAFRANGRINNCINSDGIFVDHSDLSNGTNMRKVSH